MPDIVSNTASRVGEESNSRCQSSRALIAGSIAGTRSLLAIHACPALVRRDQSKLCWPPHGFADQEAPQAHAQEKAQEDAEADPLATSRREVALRPFKPWGE